MDLTVIVLAAGQGKRMKSPIPKVLHAIGGQPMILHVLETAKSLKPNKIIVVQGAGTQLQDAISEPGLEWQEQTTPLGTGDAVKVALPRINFAHRVLILYADVPLISKETLSRFLRVVPEESVGLLTVTLPDPTGFGRIVRSAGGDVDRIVEERDANATERKIHEINTGVFVLSGQWLGEWLPCLKNNNDQKEFYLTDIISFAKEARIPICTMEPGFSEEVLGVNDVFQKIIVERHYQKRIAENLLKEGVEICDPLRFDLRGTLKAGENVSIDVNVVLEGTVSLGNGTRVGPNCILKNCEIGDHVTVLANSYCEEVKVAAQCVIGPYARLRPGTELGQGAKIGNFVEIKKSKIGEHSKINHLSYIGDTVMGSSVNVGASTITCNYDGAQKHKTIIEDNVFIGSGTQLVAPVTLGKGATLGAGTTLSRDAPPGKLTVSHCLEQRVIEGWQRPQPKKEKG